MALPKFEKKCYKALKIHLKAQKQRQEEKSVVGFGRNNGEL